MFPPQLQSTQQKEQKLPLENAMSPCCAANRSSLSFCFLSPNTCYCTSAPELTPSAVFWISYPFITSKILCFLLITLPSVSAFYIFTNEKLHAKKLEQVCHMLLDPGILNFWIWVYLILCFPPCLHHTFFPIPKRWVFSKLVLLSVKILISLLAQKALQDHSRPVQLLLAFFETKYIRLV